jgi:phosphonoacetate hydrolase
MGSTTPTITLHSRTYHSPQQPTVVICIDGFDPTYLTPTTTPTLNSFTMPQYGFHATAHCAMPSLTNPNNLSIITGAPTSAHGVSGNYYLDKTTGKEVMMVDDSSMWGSTILAELANQLGVRVAAITAKDKLRRIINHGLPLGRKGGAICFSAQFANEATLAENGDGNVEGWLGQKAPPQYSGELSLFVLDAGLRLLQENRADLFYLTLSDYIQHKHAPEEPEAEWFMGEIDRRVGDFVGMGALVVVTGDHGMSAKADPTSGEPNVLFLEDVLREKWPAANARVICPIADPFVKHHGALGGFVRVHLLGQGQANKKVVGEMLEYVRTLPEVEVAYAGKDAAERFEMPVEREGDLVVISKKNAVLGGRRDEHDLEGLKGHKLRSHGGLSEQEIPLLRSKPLSAEALERVKGRQWRNFDAFDLALNY